MITKHDVQHIAELADIGIAQEELEEFTHQFNAILDYFDLLDQVPPVENPRLEECNIWREDEVTPSLARKEAVAGASDEEEGFIRAPRVM